MASGSGVSQNYHPECEKALNDQLKLELEAMYMYISMASHFSRSDQALGGFAEYFSKAAQEEMGHVDRLCKYQNKRGGKVVFSPIKKPEKDDWGSGRTLCAQFYRSCYLWVRHGSVGGPGMASGVH